MSGRSNVEETLPRFSLQRRVTVLVLLASLVVVGAVATVGIPLELIPSGFTPPFLAVSVPWADAPAQDMLEKIVLPLEEELSTVRGLDRMFSFATTGYGRVFMNLKSGTDMDVAYREVRRQMRKGQGLWSAVKASKDPTTFTVLFEDSAAMLGLIVAFLGIFLGQITGIDQFDGLDPEAT